MLGRYHHTDIVGNGWSLWVGGGLLSVDILVRGASGKDYVVVEGN